MARCSTVSGRNQPCFSNSAQAARIWIISDPEHCSGLSAVYYSRYLLPMPQLCCAHQPCAIGSIPTPCRTTVRCGKGLNIFELIHHLALGRTKTQQYMTVWPIVMMFENIKSKWYMHKNKHKILLLCECSFTRQRLKRHSVAAGAPFSMSTTKCANKCIIPLVGKML